MPRSIRSSDLEARSARSKLPVAKKPLFVRIGRGIGLGYRRNRTAGSWVGRFADGRGGNRTEVIGVADDYENADGNRLLDFWQAQERVRALARGDSGTVSTRSIKVGEALDAYEADLRTRGGDIGNVKRVRAHLTPDLCGTTVALLASADLRRWRDGLIKSLASSTVNRTCTVLKAALNLAADHDERIANRRAWETGLATIPDAEQSRNVILGESDLRWIIAEAHEQSPEFGLFVEVAAVTGARVSQLARLEVQDLQADRADPRLLMPTSRKGRGTKKILRHPVPMPIGLADRLQVLAKDRPATAPLLLKPGGDRWEKSDHARLFRRAVKAAHRDPTEVTIYALRHSNIVRQILAAVPIRVVAVNHDTSVAMIERTYSRYIGDHADVLARGALLDTAAPVGTNVVPIRAKVEID
jgi:integrase